MYFATTSDRLVMKLIPMCSDRSAALPNHTTKIQINSFRSFVRITRGFVVLFEMLSMSHLVYL